MRYLCLVLIAALISSFGFVSEALAQRAERGGKGSAAWYLVKKPMQLPDLPPYSGKATFTGGLMYPNKPGGSAINLTYKTKEAPAMVLQWYREILKTNSWKVIKTKNAGALRATRGKNGVIVNVSDSKTPGFKSELKISYKLAR